MKDKYTQSPEKIRDLGRGEKRGQKMRRKGKRRGGREYGEQDGPEGERTKRESNERDILVVEAIMGLEKNLAL